MVTVEAVGDEAQLLHGDLIAVIGGDGHDRFGGLSIAQPLLHGTIKGGQCGEEIKRSDVMVVHWGEHADKVCSARAPGSAWIQASHRRNHLGGWW